MGSMVTLRRGVAPVEVDDVAEALAEGGSEVHGLCCGTVLEERRFGVAPLEVDDIAEALADEAPSCGPGVTSVKIGDCTKVLAEGVVEI